MLRHSLNTHIHNPPAPPQSAYTLSSYDGWISWLAYTDRQTGIPDERRLAGSRPITCQHHPFPEGQLKGNPVHLEVTNRLAVEEMVVYLIKKCSLSQRQTCFRHGLVLVPYSH